jgi:hypothetical protein
VTPGDVRERPEVGDEAVLDDEKAVLHEPGGFVLAAGEPPRVVDEVEERAADCTAGACHRRASDWIAGTERAWQLDYTIFFSRRSGRVEICELSSVAAAATTGHGSAGKNLSRYAPSERSSSA